MNWIEDILSDSPIVQGGLTLMLAGWLGYQLRALPSRLFDIARGIFTRVIEVREQHPLYDAWLEMVTEGAVRPGGPRTLQVRAARAEEDAAAAADFVAGLDTFWARICGRWCRVAVRREDGAGNGRDLTQRFIIRVEAAFTSRADLARMMQAAKQRADVAESRQLIDICDKYGARRTIEAPKRARDTLCLPRGLFESIELRIGDFLASREAYERLGVPWRFGILLFGEPGTGKTSLAHALASELSLRLAVVPLADLRSDEELIDAFSAVRSQSIILIEDVDCAFRQRSGDDASGITFSGLLNCIDGVLAPNNGRVLVMSTNHVERLDPALIRPGRVDLRIEVPLLSRSTASDYVDRLFPHIPARHEIVREACGRDRPTAAMLLNRLMQEDWRRPSAASHAEQRPARTKRVREEAEA